MRVCVPVQVMRAICEHLSEHLHYRVCAVFLLDSQFFTDANKLVAGLLAALSAMIRIGTVRALLRVISSQSSFSSHQSTTGCQEENVLET